MSAQATRDAQEVQVREAALAEMIVKIDAKLDANHPPSSSGIALNLLASAYREGAARAGSPEYKELCEDLAPTTAVEFRNLVNMVAHGDPEHWPGLTAPAVSAFANLLRPDTSDIRDGIVRSPFPLRAHTMAETILNDGMCDPKQYERLAPVLGAMAELLPHLSGDEHDRGWRPAAALSMAELLWRAPTSALAGPLQPLVQAFRQRILDVRLAPDEWEILEQHIADQVPNSPRAEALRPIADTL